ncbi:MAG TPA: hypothetical protein VKM54_00555 [Myxococcota bacterium]|nr:hypothetical protein [Myxococcota bacterium]
MPIEPFSTRHGYTGPRSGLIREDAPDKFRVAVLHAATDANLHVQQIRRVVSRTLLVMPNPGTLHPVIFAESVDFVRACDWWKVYDICEALYALIQETNYGSSVVIARSAQEFENEINAALIELGIGWQMRRGKIVAREDTETEAEIAKAEAALAASGLDTARGELAEARADMSRRPQPDLTGVIQHSIAALEAVARHCSKEPKPTLGEIVKRHAKQLGIRPPLDAAIEKIWGFCSEEGGRHGREGSEPTRREASLVLGLASSVVTYMLDEEHVVTRAAPSQPRARTPDGDPKAG